MTIFTQFKPILLTFLFISIPAFSANHYILDGGSGDGSAWNNALDTLPGTFVRGDTYYVGDGTYTGSYTLDTSESGSTFITIQKATVSSHGDETGWDNTYGDGVAVFSAAISFDTGFWNFNGVTGGGPNNWTSSHGFEFTSAAGVYINYLAMSAGISDIHIQHTYFNQSGNTEIYPTGASALYNSSEIYDSTFEYNYFDNLGSLPFFFRGGSGVTIQYNYLGNICGMSVADVNQHCEAMVSGSISNVYFRWNYVSECPSSGGYVKNDANTSDSVYIYGNYFENGAGVVCNTGNCTNWLVFNNTFNNCYGPVSGDGTRGGVTEVYNNLIYNGVGVGLWASHDYNWWSDMVSIQCDMQSNSNENITAIYPVDCDSLSETLDPFVNSSGNTPEDFNLTNEISGWPGTDICALNICNATSKQFNIDAFGNTRGNDGVWDVGAYEYDSESPTNTPTPTNTPIGTATFTPTPTNTPTATFTPTPTNTKRGKRRGLDGNFNDLRGGFD